MQSYVLQAFEIVATTGVVRRLSNRSNPAGLEHRKKSHPSDDSFFYLFESTRRDSNPTRKKLCLILLYFRKDFKHFSLGVVIL